MNICLRGCHREDTTRRRTGALLSIAHGCGMHRPQGRKSRRRTGPSRRSGRIPARGQDRVPAFPCPTGRQHVLPLPSPPFREDADGLHVGGGLPRQEGAVQGARHRCSGLRLEEVPGHPHRFHELLEKDGRGIEILAEEGHDPDRRMLWHRSVGPSTGCRRRVLRFE